MEESSRFAFDSALDKKRLEYSSLVTRHESSEIASFEHQLEERLSRIHNGESEHADIAERLLFRIDGAHYSAALTRLREALVVIPAFAPLPFSPSWLLGLFSLRTDLVTLIDPRPMLVCGPEGVWEDTPYELAHGEQALIIGESGRLVAFMVDRIGDIVINPQMSSAPLEDEEGRLSISARYREGAHRLVGSETSELAVALNLGAFYDDVISALEIWSRHE